MATSNTGDNKRPGTFAKGDPRINRKGRPKSFDALHALAHDISHEVAKDANGNEVAYNGHLLTIAELILRKWASSKDFKQQQAFMDIAYGKVPDKLELSGDKDIILRVVYADGIPDRPATATPETS